MSKYMFHTNMRCILSELVTYENIIRPTYFRHKITVLCRKCYTWKYGVSCLISEHMLHINRRLFSIRTMLHMKMCDVQTYVTRKYDVWCPNLYYIRKCTMSEPMLHMKICSLVSELMLQTKCVMSKHILHTNMRLYSARTNVTYEKV